MMQRRKLSAFRPAWIEVPSDWRSKPEFDAALLEWRDGDHRAIVKLLDAHGLGYGSVIATVPSMARQDVPRKL